MNGNHGDVLGNSQWTKDGQVNSVDSNPRKAIQLMPDGQITQAWYIYTGFT